MYSKHHLVISLVVGAIGTGIVAPDSPPAWVLVSAAGAIGVLIDLDHFVIARWNTGDWGAVKRCLASPRLVVVDQSRIFRATDVRSHQRILTHVVLTAAIIAVTGVLDTELMIIAGLVLLAHIGSDIIWDRYRQRTLRQGEPLQS